jgi:hypothetical protein
MRRPRYRQRAARAHIAALVIGIAHLRRVDEQSAFLVHHQRVVLPAILQRAASFDRLRRRGHSAAPSQAVRRCRNCAPRTAMVEVTTFQVERGQRARQMIGIEERRGLRCTEPQMPRRPRHHRQHHHRIETGKLAAVAQIGIEAGLLDVGEAQRISEKHPSRHTASSTRAKCS